MLFVNDSVHVCQGIKTLKPFNRITLGLLSPFSPLSYTLIKSKILQVNRKQN